MQPLGTKILVRDVVQLEITTESGLVLQNRDYYKRVIVEAVSESTETKLKIGDTCLCNPGGVEIERGLWLISENLLDAVI